MNANSTPTPGAQLTTSALFDDLRDCKSFNLREVGRGGGGRPTTNGLRDPQKAQQLQTNPVSYKRINSNWSRTL